MKFLGRFSLPFGAFSLVVLAALLLSGSERDALLATWRGDSWLYGIGLAAGATVLVLLGWRLSRRIGLRVQLRASEARLQSILDNAPVAISLKDRQHRYVLFNKQYQRWFGVTPEQQLGKALRDVGTDEDFSALMESIEDRVLATEAAEVLEVREPDIGTAPAWALVTK